MIPAKAREARARKHADIKRAAIEEFARHGFQGASTQAFAARAGLSKPQLNYYIDSKLDLYRAVLLDTTLVPDKSGVGPPVSSGSGGFDDSPLPHANERLNAAFYFGRE